MVAESIAVAAAGLMLLAEMLHAGRSRRLGRLAFGPANRPATWTRPLPALRVVAVGLACWGLLTLLLLDPKVHSLQNDQGDEPKNIVLVLDVSPSMYLADAGPEKKIPRRLRASQVLIEMFNRMPINQYRISLVAFYTGAKPLLKQSKDFEIIRHIIEDLPAYIGFSPGQTDLFSGLQMAAEMAKGWNPKSTIVVVLTDGVSVPASGMPRMPASVSDVLVVGVGDPISGKFIDGHQSRQDTGNLRQIANRLGGIYHDGNTTHVPSATINSLVGINQNEAWWNLSRRELALAALLLGSLILSLAPLALHYFGTSWRPGVAAKRTANSLAA